MKAHELVMQWVTDELSAGRLNIGDHLPSERSLAETLEVSRGTIREALRVLEALGSIRSSTGSGPQSGTVITAAPEQALSLALNLQLATSQVEHHHVFEMRLLLEDWAVRNSEPEHADPEHPDWMKAETLLDMMDQPGLSVIDFLNLDAQFHVALSKAANNPLASTLMDAMRTAIEGHTVERAKALPDWEATSARLRSEHRAILEAARHGRADAAADLLKEHISGYYAETAG
ncbi:FadR/GntR family transcriptional regulator [Pseudoglutamicibacter albus]|uniref:DNA-binding FadR family transcriptional regulator n=1 Tax=Pseudoglutamicibacter albus TaxID=98671 RepID=A0ABU1Z1D7_9MICC|nr:FCD domain-containing protein [Pseudoglutamicibacter albus]MDR7294427.1 DNA-binding FadR family transcriptional regulator [Pseudoglutamicibacter albus]